MYNYIIYTINKMAQVFRVDCQEESRGKKIADSKKMTQWTFYIRNAKYRLKLISSAVSGKKSVSLNGSQIYSQQHFFSTDFVFSHEIQGHNIRIDKAQEGINSFNLRIDNQQFNHLPLYLEGNNKKFTKKQESNIVKIDIDPFADFGSFSSNNANTNNNQFGEFQLDSFSNKTKKQPTEQVQFFPQSLQKQKPKKSYLQQNLLDINISACSRQADIFSNNFINNQRQLQQFEIFSTNNLKSKASNDLLMDMQNYTSNPQVTHKSKQSFIKSKINQIMQDQSLI